MKTNSWGRFAGRLFCLSLIAGIAHGAAEPFLALESVYAGARAVALDCRDCRDMHLSDWRYYGTGSSEGRINLNLDAFADPGRITFGVVGAEFGMPHTVVSFDIGFTLAEDNSGFVTCGVSRGVGRYRFGDIRVKFSCSYEYLNLSAGQVEPVPGKMNVVYTENLKIQGDEKLIFESYAFRVGGGLSLSVPLGTALKLVASPVIHYVLYRDYEYRIGEQKPTWTGAEYLEPETGSYRQAGNSPDISSWGYSLLLTLNYIFDIPLL